MLGAFLALPGTKSLSTVLLVYRLIGLWQCSCTALPLSIQESAVADEPARCAASRRACCKQRWTLIVINLRPNYVDNACDGRHFRVIASYLSKVANSNLPHLHLLPLLTPFEFCVDRRHQKTRVGLPVLSCGVVYVI